MSTFTDHCQPLHPGGLSVLLKDTEAEDADNVKEPASVKWYMYLQPDDRTFFIERKGKTR